MKSRLLRIKDFTVLVSARLQATMSLQSQAVIVGWHVYTLRPDPLLLGLVGLAEALPAITFAFFAGHVVDNRKPARVYQTCISILLLNSIALWLVTSNVISLSRDAELFFIFLAVFISGAVRSFTSPSIFSLIPQIVPRTHLVEAAAWNSWTFQTAAVVGPALGGILYGLYDAPVAFLFPPIMMLGCWIASRFFSSATMKYQSQSPREPFLKSIATGIRFAVKQKILLSAMTLDMFSVLFGGAAAILPMFSDQVLHAGPQALGVLRATPAIGSGIVALFLALKPMTVISGKMLLWMVALFGLASFGFAFSRDLVAAFVFLLATGVFDGVSLVIRNTILQLLTPEHMRGRISSLSLIFITSSNEIGAFESGVAAKLLGLIPSLIFGGAMTMGVVGLTAWRSPELRRMRIDLRERDNTT